MEPVTDFPLKAGAHRVSNMNETSSRGGEKSAMKEKRGQHFIFVHLNFLTLTSTAFYIGVRI